jgi:DNA repair exonuclease SbcCD ATPase subunit
MSEDKLTKDDLVLLMESYRNMITMHQTILDQSEKTIEKMGLIADKQDALYSKQNSVCNTLNNVSSSLDSANASIAKAAEVSIRHEKEIIKQHNKIETKIHLGWIGMGTIILGLIGLIITLSDFIQHTPIP